VLRFGLGGCVGGAVAIDGEQGAAVQEAVEHGGGYDGVVEDLAIG
jgi:hypothetical protein